VDSRNPASAGTLVSPKTCQRTAAMPSGSQSDAVVLRGRARGSRLARMRVT
jgi:hypothetical protein